MRRLELPVITPAEAERERRLARRRRPGALAAGGLAYLVAPLPLWRAAREGETWRAVDLAVAGAPARAHLPAHILGALFRAGDTPVDPDALDPATRGMVLEHLLAPVLARLEEGGLPPVEIARVGEPERGRPDADLALAVEAGSLRTTMLLSAPPRDLALVEAFLDALPLDPAPFAGLKGGVSLRAGVTELGADELARVGPGDGILFDDSLLSRRGVVAVVGERYAQGCRIEGERVTLAGPLLTRPNAGLRRWLMSDADETSATDLTEPDRAGLGEVPVRLAFEVGRVELPLGELETLGEGYVFELPRPPSSFVDILAGGRIIGGGELVRVGESIGVRVTRLNR